MRLRTYTTGASMPAAHLRRRLRHIFDPRTAKVPPRMFYLSS
jgi:hypothetical protein